MLKILNTLSTFFEDTTTEIAIREFARLKKISPATAATKLKTFEKEGMLQSRKDRGYILFSANTDNKQFKGLSIIYWEEKLAPLVEKINTFYAYPQIILFGSIQKVENVKQSDIDIAIISPNTKEFPSLRLFETKLKRTIQIFNLKDLKSCRNEKLLNNILNGKVIEGKVEWI